MNRLYAQLCRYDAAAWRSAVSTLGASIHEIDRNATPIWFAFFPLELHQLLESAEHDPAKIRRLGLMGRWSLADQVDSSHRFLFAHRYWPQVKAAIALDQPWPEPLAATIT